MTNKQVSLESKDCKSKHRWYDVIVAWASGEEIQCSACNEAWVDYVPYAENSVPAFNCNEFCWRIKPRTRIKRYRMALVYDHGVVSVDITNSSLDDPIEYNVQGFIRWVGDSVEIEVESKV